jgi:thermostable 8-oxoguanine DNA glycosylase
MENIEQYLKYYSLEDYLFGEVNKNFRERGYLTPEEFFAIVFWKRKPAAFQIVPAWDKESIETITGKLNPDDRENSFNILLGNRGGIREVGIAIASAILTVCYPKEFTVLDYRALNSLRKLKSDECKKLPLKAENFNLDHYFNYLKICKDLAKEIDISLRNLDRTLWAMDWYKGKPSGLVEVVKTYKEQI